MNHRDVRLVAVGLMCRLDGNRGSLTTLLPEALADVAPAERPQLQALAFGLCRWSVQGSALLNQLLQKPMKAKDADVVWLLKLGLFQLLHTRMPAHAAVDETVKVTAKLDKSWARGLVNGVLRNFQRNQESLLAALDITGRLSHPQWLIEHFRRDWPDQWEAICDANNRQAPMTLRVNSARSGREAWTVRLLEAEPEITAEPSVHAGDAVTITPALPVQRLPGFDQGDVSVQDAAAQISVDLLIGAGTGIGSHEAGSDAATNEQNKSRHGRLLDACSAPGGKTAHALERGYFEQVVALDNDEGRLKRVEDTLQRLDLLSSATLIHADAGEPASWWDTKPFDAILLDAPCSGTGVIRRHPDIKQLRRPGDIKRMVEQQARLLDALWPLVAPGGVLLYCTCSILKAENEQQVTDFLSRTDDASVDLPSGAWGSARPVDDPAGRQILPDDDGMDGFFHARLVKNR